MPIGIPWQSRHGSKRPKKNDLWTDDNLKQALAIVDNGMNIHKASETFHISYSILREWCYGQRMSRKRGNKDVLIPKEEQLLVDWLLRMCEMRHSLLLTTVK